MIKIFRHIRKSMIKENKTTKYLLYAIGEIILVVIGILIALSINNANEGRKARKQEVKYLKNLQADLLLEFKNIDSIIAFRSNKAKASAHLLDFKELETVSHFLTFEEAIYQVFFWQTFIPTNNTYKELLGSGNLNYITNDSIKNHLLELDKKYVFIANVEHHMRREYEEYLYDISIHNSEMLNAFDFQKTAENGAFVFIEPSQIPVNTLIPQYKKVLGIKSFINGLKLSVMNNVALINYHTEMTAHLQKLNELIIDDLKKD
ncbi:DUF6090 family protein [uncultured Winogradskyella sp.]|uniref:DUF6090 family protein n=1 Tax=uncultured Winogradskyella sp. TaxID=395353 RepID=UPI0030D9F490|tara:strand:+ start:15092 stop:15877 length:786 start_codon:yes stop_codon:yes gene_type:complete